LGKKFTLQASIYVCELISVTCISTGKMRFIVISNNALFHDTFTFLILLF